MAKKTKKLTRKQITKKLDKIISKIVRLRDKKCVCCGSTDKLQCGHYVSRKYNALRWDLTNCHAQCGGCNIIHNRNPSTYSKYMIESYGTSIFKELENKLLAYNGFKINYLRLRLKELENILSNLSDLDT